MNIHITYLLLFFYPCLTFCQDTNFVAKHSFPTPVRNVFTAENAVYVKTGDGLYKLEDNKWELQKMKFEKSYVFFNKGFVEADYLPNSHNIQLRANGLPDSFEIKFICFKGRAG